MPFLSALLVEDNPLTQQIAQALLLSQKCSVDVVGTGLEALEKFKQHGYHIVLMDIGLPDITGYEVTERIRAYEVEQHQAPTWIVGLTASVEKEEFYEGIHAGMNEIYAKPLSAQLLDEILKKANNPLAEPVSRQEDACDQRRVIDLDYGAKILGSNVEAAEKMVAELVNMLPGDLAKIQAAFSQHDYRTLKDLAHYLKGGASFCGTPQLKEAASSLDKAIKTHSNDHEVEAAYNHLCQEIDSVMNEYHRHIKKEGE